MRIRRKILFLMLCILATMAGARRAYAVNASFQVSPMYQKITLVPGERFYGTFKVTNPNDNEYGFRYETNILPFRATGDGNNVVFEKSGDYNQIIDWITIVNDSAVVMPNNTAIVQFYIDVPEDAPAGGQYASINVSTAEEASSASDLNIKSKYAIAHLLYAEVAGETIRGGEFGEVIVPGFLFDGDISGTVTITNTGNVHSDATYTLQVFPLFSKEEIYTNEEDPKTNTVLPGAARTTTISWEETPKMGIFHVVYSAEFEGVTSTVDKYVIVCPIWLLFIIVAAFFLVLFRVLFRNDTGKR